MQNEKDKHYATNSLYLCVSWEYNKFVEPVYKNSVPTVCLHGSTILNIGDFIYYRLCETVKIQEAKYK